MENMWLMSESEGLGMHVLTVFHNGAVERQVQHALQIPLPMKIAFACSLGYPASPAEPYLRVRRELEDFVHHNQFGHKDVLWSAMHPGVFQTRHPEPGKPFGGSPSAPPKRRLRLSLAAPSAFAATAMAFATAVKSTLSSGTVFSAAIMAGISYVAVPVPGFIRPGND